MASNALAAGTTGRGFMADQAFFTRFAILLSVFIVIAFVQARLLGHVMPGPVPLMLHVHGGLMIAWLGVYVLQNSLISAGQVALHRKTGWLAVAVGAAAVGFGSFTGYHAIDAGRVPPFFSDAFFLALTQVGTVIFAAVVTYAIVKRRDVQWHRRLMIGSGVLVTEPAFGRVVPLPLTGQTVGELIILVLQLGLVGIIARHDRKQLGAVHPATLIIALALVAHHLLIELLARLPAWQSLAASIAAG